MRHTTGLLILSVLAGAACENPGSMSPEDSDRLIRSRNGLPVSESQMRAALRNLTRTVAMSLDDPAARNRVYQSMEASPFREKKLHFASFLDSDGTQLRSDMAARRGLTVEQTMERLGDIADLEFYMPVEAHRLRWDGGADLLVATALRDGDLPTAFDLKGREVQVDYDQPPTVPTLVLVPVETNFDRPTRQEDDVNSAFSQTSAPGYWLTKTRIPNREEHWSRGAPELEVHVFVQNSVGDYIDVHCAGEEQTFDSYYNQDGLWWNNPNDPVLLILETGIGESKTEIQIWENDTDACTPDSGKPPHADGTTYSEIANAASDIIDVFEEGISLGKQVKAILKAIPSTINLFGGDDDLVGIVQLAGPGAGCFEPSGPSRFDILRPNGAANGYAMIDVTFGTRDPICPPDMGISGPASLETGQSGAWTVSHIGGGGAPFAYQWYKDEQYQPGATSASFATSFTSGGNHTLKVRITPTGYPVLYETLTVNVSGGGGGCHPWCD